MKKKILSALLVGAMVSSLLAGCGGSDSASTSDNSTSAGSSDAQTTEQGSSDATAEASGIEGKTVAFIPKLTGNAFFEVANDGAQEYAEIWGITVDYMGSTAGLERLDLLLPKLAPYVDCFMGTRGAIRTCLKPEYTNAIALRVTSGSSMVQADLSHEVVAVDIEDSIRMNADCMASQVFIGADGQLSSIDNLSKVINAGMRYSVPTLGVCAVGKDMERTDRFFKLATRIIAEMGCQMVKTYNCENFEEVVAACPVPIVVAGGKKLAEKDALTLAYDVISKGARGVDMGRNIFQSQHPAEMAQAVHKVVHEGFTDKEAYEFYEDLIH